MRDVELTGTDNQRLILSFIGVFFRFRFAQSKNKFLVVIAAGLHLVTCRTQQLSLQALMVLYGVHTGEQIAARAKF